MRRRRRRLCVTRMEGQFLDIEGRLWVRDDRRVPGSQQMRFHVQLCGACHELASPVAYLRHRTQAVVRADEGRLVVVFPDLPEARCESCVVIVAAEDPAVAAAGGGA